MCRVSTYVYSDYPFFWYVVSKCAWQYTGFSVSFWWYADRNCFLLLSLPKRSFSEILEVDALRMPVAPQSISQRKQKKKEKKQFPPAAICCCCVCLPACPIATVILPPLFCWVLWADGQYVYIFTPPRLIPLCCFSFPPDIHFWRSAFSIKSETGPQGRPAKFKMKVSGTGTPGQALLFLLSLLFSSAPIAFLSALFSPCNVPLFLDSFGN